MARKRAFLVGAVTIVAAAFGSATTATAAKPDKFSREWMSSGWISCTASNGTVYDEVMAFHGWQDKTTTFYRKGGVVTRTVTKATADGSFSNSATGITVYDKVTRTTTQDAATGIRSESFQVTYFRNGATVLKEQGRRVYDRAGNLIQQSGTPSDPNRTALCDLMA